MLSITSEINIPDSEFTFSFARSSGPGGQNVNKVNSKALLRWNPGMSPSLPQDVYLRFYAKYRSRITDAGEILITSDRHRDQKKNQNDCLEKLSEMILSVAYPPKPRKKTKPTYSSQKVRRQSKHKHSEKKQGRKKPSQDY